MKNISILFISDTHGKHRELVNLPDADIIVHAGDISSRGSEHQIRLFLEWFSGLDQFKHKIFIAGNHDWLYETNRTLAKSLIPSNVIYLEDSGVEIEGINFYGSPGSKEFCNWAFNRPDESLINYWKMIPDNTDVLITHSPPHTMGDFVTRVKSHEGSRSLYDEIINRIKPIIHVSGHIHQGYGLRSFNNIIFINASNLDEDYQYTNYPILAKI